MNSQSVEWYQSLENDVEFLAEEAKIDFAVCLERRLMQNGMSKTDLSRRLSKSQAYVTKVLRGDSNLTIATMVQLADAVDSNLHLYIAPRQSDVRWFEVVKGGAKAIETEDNRRAATVWAKYASKGSRVHVPLAV